MSFQINPPFSPNSISDQADNFLQVCLHTNRKVRFCLIQTLQFQNFLAKLYLFKFKLDIFRAREATTNIKQMHIETKFSLK